MGTMVQGVPLGVEEVGVVEVLRQSFGRLRNRSRLRLKNPLIASRQKTGHKPFSFFTRITVNEPRIFVNAFLRIR